MAATPLFVPIETPYGWMVSVPSSMSGDGKRRKKYFEHETDALKFAAKLRATWKAGVRNAVMPANIAIQAAEAARVLDGTGLSILDAARIAKSQLADSGGAELFKDRLNRCLLVGEAHWSARYADDMGRIFQWVPEWFMMLQCAAITRETITRALKDGKKLSQSTIDNRARYVSSALGHRDRHRKTSTIQILTKQQCRALLRACESKDELRAVALLLFAGVRPDAENGEIRRLQWDDVGDKEIYISGEASKTNSDRHIQVLPRLARLLRGHPKEGPVTPVNWKRVWKRLRATAGIPEVQDICRHTYASMLLAWHQGDEGPVKLALGHTRSSDTLFRHYRKAVTLEDGKKFFR